MSLVCLSVGLFAAEQNSNYYVGYNSGVVNSTDDGYFGGSEHLSNVVYTTPICQDNYFKNLIP